MKLDNPFSNETRRLFEGCECFECELGVHDALHHIKGRESNSALNACPVHNMTCHFHIGGKLGLKAPSLMRKTILHLSRIGYRFVKKDIEFLNKYRTLYEARVPLSMLEEMNGGKNPFV